MVVAFAGLLVAWALVTADAASAWRRVVWFASAAALSVGMLLAIGWSTAAALGIPYLDLATMVRTHGALDALAVTAMILSWPRVADAG
jgi:hypothetical protein